MNGLPFLSKTVYKGARGLNSGWSLSVYLLSTPPSGLLVWQNLRVDFFRVGGGGGGEG